MMGKEIYFCTSSKTKFEQCSAFFKDFGISVTQVSISIPEVQSINVEDVALQKLKIASLNCAKRPLIVDDAGLEIEGLRAFPGALLKPILEHGGIGLLKSISASVSKDQKVPAAMVAAVAIDFGDETMVTKGVLTGHMDFSDQSRSSDTNCSASFYPSGQGDSLADLRDSVGDGAFVHRWAALREIAEVLLRKGGV